MWLRGILGVLFCVTGAVWIAQGLGYVHGSFMTGEMRWTFFGVIAVLMGLTLLSLARRARRGSEATTD